MVPHLMMMNRLPRWVVVVLALVIATGTASSSGSQQAAGQRAAAIAPSFVPVVSQAVGFAISPPLSDIAVARADAAPVAPFVREMPEPAGEIPEDRIKTTPGVSGDAAIQRERPALSMPSPLMSFDGNSSADNNSAFGFRVYPPDTNGEVGPNHYVQTTNLLVRVWNKTGTPLTAPFKLSSLFASLGGECAGNGTGFSGNHGDPIVLYDQLADRWLLSQFNFFSLGSPPYHQCIAISTSGNPLGTWFVYDFVMPDSDFNDYPHFGVWPDGYYMTDNQFRNGGAFSGGGAFAFDRLKMLAGNPAASYIYFNLGTAFGGMLPSDIDGYTLPPAGAPNFFSQLETTTSMSVWGFHADFATPSNSTFLQQMGSPLTIAAFDLNSPGRNSIEQPPPATASAYLDPIQDRLMHRLAYRNFGSWDAMVVTHTVNVGGDGLTPATHQAAVRYYQIRRTLPGGSFFINEQATFAPDTDNRWMGSAAMDSQGNIAVGYSVSSLTTFPSIRYAGRLASDPPNGLFQGEATLVPGSGVQLGTAGRWGDYSALSVDPSDDCTFWYTQEYYTAASQATSTVGWLTRIGSFKFPSCMAPTPAPLLTIDSFSAVENPGNGNGVINPGEGAQLFVTLHNSGAATAGFINATLSSSTPGVIITQPAMSAYSDLAPGSSNPNITPFRFTVSPTAGCPLNINFSLTVTFTGGGSPAVIPFTVATGPGSYTITTTLDGVAPAASPGVGTATGTQTGRLFRDGIPNSCGVPKLFAGTFDSNPRQYDLYNFSTCPESVATCASITTFGPAVDIFRFFTAAYSPSFNPASITTNWKGDPGSSGRVTYQLNVGAGPQTVGVVVHETNVGGGVGQPYTLTVTGLCAGACMSPNQLPVAMARNITVSSGTGLAAASINNGSFDPDGDPITITQTPPGPYPIGETFVWLTVTDPKGATTQAFGNVTVSPKGDLNLDGKADVMLRNGSTGQNIGWLMNGLAVSTSMFLPTIADTNWKIVGDGDLDGDGKTDVLWRNSATGQNIGWLMSGLTVSSSAFLPTIADTNWEIVGVGDLDGDFKADVVWRHKSSGQNIGWLMNGLTVATSAFLPTIADTNWEIKGVNDLNGDGKADVIWRHKSSGQNIGWLMNGLTVATSAFLPTIADTNWEIVGVGDLDGDGKADVVWRNKATGQNIGWLMNGLSVATAAFLPTIADTNWKIVGVGDLDMNGKADILWRNGVSGQDIGWLMNGLTVATAAFLPTIADTNWQIVYPK